MATALSLTLAALPAIATAQTLPALPQVYIDTTYAPPVGNTITVNAGGNLQAAINSANPGDTIVLQAGATFTGPFTLPDKGASTQWIYIRTSAYGSLPTPGNRVAPTDASKMPAIIGTGSPVIAVQTSGTAHHYRFVGIEFRPSAGQFATALVRLGTASETSTSQLPHDITFDRCYLHGDPTIGGRRAIALNGIASAVVDSYLSDWKDVGNDSQALLVWNTPGPVKLVNNYFEGAAENVMFGGADPSIANLVPADIEIRGNRFAKPVAWRTQNWTVKNLFELKLARRILIEGNIFENDWEAAQNFMMNVKSVNQDGTAPWSITEDYTFRYNIVRHGPSAIKFCGVNCDAYSTAQGGRYLVQNNLFDDISSANWGGAGNFFQTANPTPGLIINHNTAIHDGSPFAAGDGGEGADTGFQLTDNVFQRFPYGFKGTGGSEGIGTLNLFFPGWIFSDNALVGGVSGIYPANNFFPVSYQGVQFVDLTNKDYRLAPTSPYKNAANDGRDVGADIVGLNAATACALDGQCGSPRPPPAVVNPFTFTSQTNVEPGALVTSNVVTVSGTNINQTVPISISGGGAYAIGCGSFMTTTTGMISAGQNFCVQYRAPATLNTTTTSTVTVNGVSATFSSTTASAYSPTGDADNDGIPNAVESTVARNMVVKDNDVFGNAQLFTMQQYRDFFAREGDAGGISYWSNLITTGTTRPAVINAFFFSPEFTSFGPPVTRLYFATFLRFPDYGGLVFQMNAVHSGTPLAVVANNFTLSPEFMSRYGALNDTQYVTLLYQNILNRTPTQAEIDFHVNRLQTGATRGDVLVGFSESPEYIAKYGSETNTILAYATLLRRIPTPAEFNGWVISLDGGAPALNLLTSLFNSAEYSARGFLF